MRRRAIIGKSKVSADPNARPEGPGGFKMQIQTTTANEVFTLPTNSGYTYNATVLWGDGTQSSVTGHNVNNSKTYTTPGIYNIEIKGTFDMIYFNNTGSKLLVKKILSWGGTEFIGFTAMNNAFYGCSNLNELAEGGIKGKSNLSVTNFNATFLSCSNLTTLPTDLFKYNTLVTNFIQTFMNCSSLTSLPTNLFKYNTAVTSFGYTFMNCTSLTTLPTDLFRYNTLVTDFNYTFMSCSKLQLRSDIFGATPNFGTRVMNFYSCFSRTSFTGTQGTAPALWGATMNASSTKTSCFGGAGNSATSLTNYASIPAAWK